MNEFEFVGDKLNDALYQIIINYYGRDNIKEPVYVNFDRSGVRFYRGSDKFAKYIDKQGTIRTAQ